jgi:hypothetical protein
VKLSAELLLQSWRSRKFDTMSYRNLASQRLQPTELIGDGRFAIKGRETGRVWLFTSLAAAERMLGSRCQLIDLGAEDLMDMLDRMPERTDAKRR